MANELEEPVILIIASRKLSTWQDEIDICNYSPTKFYLNNEHHSVSQLRKKLKDPAFWQNNCETERKLVQLCTLDEVTKMGTNFSQVPSIISDDTGEVEIILKDREMRTLLGKNVEELENQDKAFPKLITSIQGKQYSLSFDEDILKKTQATITPNPLRHRCLGHLTIWTTSLDYKIRQQSQPHFKVMITMST
ncbi:hypothetical protein POM88_012095 [Heracleum sosnowskyi]|uniref:Uncharacterized protein n=1 Tax=Heracleum sosnowskyi TaxID=360622 RepID=A0AAD8IVS6_9APIA|nr:hypothetical protein POM88_012095 [Heracleum sosnowskyi]